MLKISKNIFQAILKKSYKFKIPLLYLLVLLLSGFLFTAYQIYPQLTTCSKLFGVEFCTPTGVFTALIISIPGYLIAGGILGINDKTPLGYSIPVVFFTALTCYFLLGLLVDNLKKLKLNKDQRIIYSVTIVFIFLLFLFFVLRK